MTCAHFYFAVFFLQVAKQWYDYERSSYHFVRLLRGGNKLTFTHMQDFDENGILYWLGTNGKSIPDWVNPGSVGILSVSTSEGRGLPYGKVEDILSRDAAALNCHTNDDKYVNIASIDQDKIVRTYGTTDNTKRMQRISRCSCNE